MHEPMNFVLQKSIVEIDYSGELSGTFFQVLMVIFWTFDNQNTATNQPCKI